MNCTLTACINSLQLDSSVSTTFRELYIPSRTLPYGVYEFKITVTILGQINLTRFSSAFVRITPSGITANLVRLGTSMITRGYHQSLELNPGDHSIDFDTDIFNASVS